ncbi:unnamed protein product [Cuscuta campestris]|uniref:Saposin B-type domain-containing protein n=1 Tax=Cuscuta campestris TaxID=132261 RepID=A0A484LYA5_9ASTE|nr:unnamed protein product [Cuscuta campestris]
MAANVGVWRREGGGGGGKEGGHSIYQMPSLSKTCHSIVPSSSHQTITNLTQEEKQEAHWILKIDIVEQGDGLALIEQDMEGKCHSKCKTIERACQEVMDYCDTDVAEYLYNNNNLELDSLVNFLCKDLSKACNKTPPPLPKDREPGEPFVPKPEEDVEMEKILRSMQGMSMNPWGAQDMRMYSPEELTRYGNGDED